MKLKSTRTLRHLRSLAALVGCALGVQVASAQLTPEDLVAYWDFDTLDSPGESSALIPTAPALLTFNGNAAQTADSGGRTGTGGDYALDLGGHNDQSWAQTEAGPHFDDLTTGGNYTVSWWQFNRQQANNSTFWVHAPNADGNQRGIQGHVPWGNGTIYFDQSGCCDPPERLTVGGQIVLNEWQHFAFVRDVDNNFRKIFVNGVEVASADAGDVPDPFNGILTIGAEGPNGNNSLNGVVDEFALWRVALTADDIAALASKDTITTALDLLVIEDGTTRINLAGAKTMDIELGLGWTDPGVDSVEIYSAANDQWTVIPGGAAAVAIDDSDLLNNITTMGTYDVVYTYDAADPAIDSTATRKVTVVDTVPGTVTLVDDTPQANQILAGTGPWVDPGATAEDANGGGPLNVFSSAAKPPASATLGKWTFDDDTLEDSSYNMNHGVAVGSPEFSSDTPFGKGGRSIDFLNANNGVEVSDGTPEESTFDIKPWYRPVSPNQLEIVGPWQIEASTGIPYTVAHNAPFTPDNDRIDEAVAADPGLAVSEADAINFGNGSEGRIPGDTPGPIEGLDNVSFRAAGTLRVLVEDDYLIGFQGDDGASLVIEGTGAQFEPVLLETSNGTRVITPYTEAPRLLNSGTTGDAADFIGAAPAGDPFLDGGAAIPLLETAGALADPTVPEVVSNNSANFTGNVFIDTPRVEAFNTPDPDVNVHFPGAASEFSVEFWAKPTAFGDLVSPINNLRFSGAAREGWLFYQSPEDSWEFRVGNASTYIAPIRGNAGEIVYGEWTHVVGVLRLDKANPADPFYEVDLYVNGVLVNSAFLPDIPTVNPIPESGIRIGGTQQNIDGGAARFFNGCLDEIAVYDKPLDAATVMAHYQNGINNPARAETYPALVQASGPLGYWRLEESAPAVDTSLTGIYGPGSSGNVHGVGRIHLTPGDYPIKYIYREGGGGEYAEVFARRDVQGDDFWIPLTNGGTPGLPKGGLMYISFFAKKQGWGDGWGAFVSKFGESGQGWNVRRRAAEDRVIWTRRGSGNDDPNQGFITKVPNGDWHHIMVALDGDTVRQWVDGELDYSFASSGVVNPAVGYTLGFGVRDNAPGPGGTNVSWYRGQMDDICIYDTPLTDEQLFAHVSGGDGVNTDVPGEYKVRYISFDGAGNPAWAERTVTVLPNPALPVITLNGDAEQTIEASQDAYVDPGATVATGPGAPTPNDPLGDATVSGTVDLSTPGTYLLTYTYSDQDNGKALDVTRVVQVVDTTPPVITIDGPSEISIAVGEELVLPNATATDIISGNLTVYKGSSPGTLLGHWNFDDVANPGLDSSGMGRDLQMINDPLITDFDGVTPNNFYLDASLADSGAFVPGGAIANDLYEAGTDDLTVCSWVRGWPDGNWEPWISKRGEGGQGWQVRRHSSTTNATFTTRGIAQDDAPQAEVLDPFTWYHVAAVLDRSAGEKRIYLNGVLAATQGGLNGNSVTNATNHALTLGARDNGSETFGNWSRVSIDEVQLYRRVLSEAEIADLADPDTGVDVLPNIPAEGFYEVVYTAVDAAGNSASKTVSVTVGNAGPPLVPELVDVFLNEAQDQGSVVFTGLTTGETYHLVASTNGTLYFPVAGSEFVAAAEDEVRTVPVDLAADPTVIVKGARGALPPPPLIIDTPYLEDFEANDGSFERELYDPGVTAGANPSGPWTYGLTGANGTNGWSVWGGGGMYEDWLTTPLIRIGADGPATLEFDHSYDFEAAWDGAVIMVSVNGGAYMMVTDFSQNGYSQALQTDADYGYPDDLNGIEVFNGNSGGFIHSVANLGTFAANDLIRVRFRGFWDWGTLNGDPNWAIDNVEVKQAP